MTDSTIQHPFLISLPLSLYRVGLGHFISDLYRTCCVLDSCSEVCSAGDISQIDLLQRCSTNEHVDMSVYQALQDSLSVELIEDPPIPERHNLNFRLAVYPSVRSQLTCVACVVVTCSGSPKILLRVWF